MILKYAILDLQGPHKLPSRRREIIKDSWLSVSRTNSLIHPLGGIVLNAECWMVMAFLLPSILQTSRQGGIEHQKLCCHLECTPSQLTYGQWDVYSQKCWVGNPFFLGRISAFSLLLIPLPDPALPYRPFLQLGKEKSDADQDPTFWHL